MELYHSHKGKRIRFPGHDDYASRLDVALIGALIHQTEIANSNKAKIDALVAALQAVKDTIENCDPVWLKTRLEALRPAIAAALAESTEKGNA